MRCTPPVHLAQHSGDKELRDTLYPVHERRPYPTTLTLSRYSTLFVHPFGD